MVLKSWLKPILARFVFVGHIVVTLQASFMGVELVLKFTS